MTETDLENQIDLLFDFITLFLSSKGIYGVCLPCNLIFVEGLKAMGIDAELVSGFGLSGEFSFWHCWTVIKNCKNGKEIEKEYDISYELLKKIKEKYPDENMILPDKPILRRNLPEGQIRIDMEDHDEIRILKENIEFFEFYEKEGNTAFWKLLKKKSNKNEQWAQNYIDFQELRRIVFRTYLQKS